MSDQIVHVTDSSFDSEVLNSEVPVLVDFWAEWCMPCKMISPILNELSETYGDKLVIGKVNVDEQAESITRTFLIR